MLIVKKRFVLYMCVNFIMNATKSLFCKTLLNHEYFEFKKLFRLSLENILTIFNVSRELFPLTQHCTA